MKRLMILFALLISAEAFSSMSDLEIKSAMSEEILKDDLLKLHSRMVFSGERMIAGEFEEKEKKIFSEKKTFSDRLRSRLGISPGFNRF